MNRESAWCVDAELSARAQPVVDVLRRAKLSVITAESCTGGLIAAILTHGLQASDCLHGGFFTYTKANKAAVLGVDRFALAALPGAESPNTPRLISGAVFDRKSALFRR